jgi:hypothetical protein
MWISSPSGDLGLSTQRFGVDAQIVCRQFAAYGNR